jgi:hypothetical protein
MNKENASLSAYPLFKTKSIWLLGLNTQKNEPQKCRLPLVLNLLSQVGVLFPILSVPYLSGHGRCEKTQTP